MKLNRYLRADNQFSQRLATETFGIVVNNINKGIISDVFNNIGSVKPLYVSDSFALVHKSMLKDGNFEFTNLKQAVLNPIFPTASEDYNSSEFAFVVKHSDTFIHIKGIFSPWDINTKPQVDWYQPSENGFEPVFEDDIPVVEVVEDAIDNSGVIEQNNAQYQEDVKYIDEMKKVQTELQLLEKPQTLSVKPSNRKHLTDVSNKEDVYFDKELLTVEESNMFISALESELLPRQITESGDMVFNPKGGVLVYTLLKQLNLSDFNLEDYLNKPDYLDYYQFTLGILLLEGKDVQIDKSALLYHVLTRGLAPEGGNLIYPLSKGQLDGLRDVITVAEIELAFKESIENKYTSDVSALACALQESASRGIANSNPNRFLNLTSKVNRTEFIKAISKVDKENQEG